MPPMRIDKNLFQARQFFIYTYPLAWDYVQMEEIVKRAAGEECVCSAAKKHGTLATHAKSKTD